MVKKKISKKKIDWVHISIGISILVFILIIIFAYITIGNKTKGLELIKNNNNLKLYILEDDNCKLCQSEIFANQIQKSFNVNFTIEKNDLSSELAKEILSSTGIKQQPIYMFSDEILNVNNYNTSFRDVLMNIKVNSNNYYILNPIVVRAKVVVNEPPIPQQTLVLGNEDAKVTVYEFCNYESEGCGILHNNEYGLNVYQNKTLNPNFQPTFDRLKKEYIDTGKIKYVYYNFNPLNELSKTEILASLCAKDQGKWLEYSSILYKNQEEWQKSYYRAAKYYEYANSLGLEMDKFNSCYASKKFDQQNEDEIIIGKNYGFYRTPTLIIDNYIIEDLIDYNLIKAMIELKLNEKE